MEVLIIEVSCLVPAFDQYHLSCSVLGKDSIFLPKRLSHSHWYTLTHMYAHPLWQGSFTHALITSKYKTLLFYITFYLFIYF